MGHVHNKMGTPELCQMPAENSAKSQCSELSSLARSSRFPGVSQAGITNEKARVTHLTGTILKHAAFCI